MPSRKPLAFDGSWSGCAGQPASLSRRLPLTLFSFSHTRFKRPREVFKCGQVDCTGCTRLFGHSQITMAMGRNLRVFHNLGHSSPGRGYSLILEHKALREMLLVEDFAIDNLSKFSVVSDATVIYAENVVPVKPISDFPPSCLTFSCRCSRLSKHEAKLHKTHRFSRVPRYTTR